jgi:hypothetical protein
MRIPCAASSPSGSSAYLYDLKVWSKFLGSFHMNRLRRELLKVTGKQCRHSVVPAIHGLGFPPDVISNARFARVLAM